MSLFSNSFLLPFSYLIAISIIIIIIIIIIILCASFHISYNRCTLVLYWNASDNKTPKISRTLTSILADFNSAVVCIVVILPLISYSPSIFLRFSGTVQRAPITIGITVTFIFSSFSSLSQGPGICLSFRFLIFFLCCPLE